jgi:hypothetical protein
MLLSNSAPSHYFIELPHDPAILLLGIIRRNVLQDMLESLAQPYLLQQYLQYPNFGNSPNAPRLMNGLRKMCYIYTTEFSTLKKNEIMLFADKWMELENIMLSKVSYVQKVKGHMFSLICRN